MENPNMSNPQSKTATVSKAFGKNLNEFEGVTVTEVTVTYAYDALTDLNEVPADEALEPEDELAVINARRNAAARAKAVNAELTKLGISAPALTDQEKATNAMVRSLVLMGTSEDDARQMVASLIANTPKGRS
jgi:hypothetical protein